MASTDSPNSSVSEGCGWMNSATSSTVASQFTPRYPPESCSVTQGPTMCTPRICPARPSGSFAAMIFTSTELLNRRLGPATPRTAMTGRAALTRLCGQQVAINFGYEPMLLLDAEGIDNFLGIPATPESAGPSQ